MGAAQGAPLPAAERGDRPGGADRNERGSERDRERARTSPDVPTPEDHGYGVNLINVRDPREDIFDIPTFLRRQMD